MDIRRMSPRTSGATAGRPGPFRRLLHFQKSVKPVRCHRITVAGWTTETASVQPLHRRDSRTQNRRSEVRRRGRDAVYRMVFSSRVQALGIREVKAAPRSPWQNPYVERLIGTLRRECLDHVVVLNEIHLRRLLRDYLAYYHRVRTHLSLEKDSPEPRPVERPDHGRIVETPMVGGLHHRYSRLAA